MNTLPYVSYANFKRFAKLLSKRLTIKLAYAQAGLSQASGYGDLHQLQSMRPIPGAESNRMGSLLPTGTWVARLRKIFGPMLDGAFDDEELALWCGRIHRRRDGEAQTTSAADFNVEDEYEDD